MRWPYFLIAALILAIGAWANWPNTEPLSLRLKLVRTRLVPGTGIDDRKQYVVADLKVTNTCNVEVGSWAAHLDAITTDGQTIKAPTVGGRNLGPGKSATLSVKMGWVRNGTIDRVEMVASEAVAKRNGYGQKDVIEFVP